VRLGEALRIVVDLDYGYLSRRRSMPVVVDAGYDEAASVWWVVAENGKFTITRNVEQLLLARLDTAATAFALSPAQHRLAIALVEGLSLADAATNDGVALKAISVSASLFGLVVFSIPADNFLSRGIREFIDEYE
jgi:hypothetical protein